jgi:serine/threonine-protein kinase
VVVPRLEGLSEEDATSKLAELGLDPTLDPVRRASDRLPPDVVAMQKPEPGDSVKQGHVVRFWLSAGPTSVRLPDLRGRDSADAVAILKSSELILADSVSWQQSVEYPAGKVVATTPKAGTILSRGSRVGLVLSAGDSTAAASDSTRPRIF